MIRFGVVGCGSIAEVAHLPSIAVTEGAEAAAICDVDRARLDDVGTRWGVRARYRDAEEMFAAEPLDAVIVATPNNLHRNQAVAAARAGLHVLVEKPLAITNHEAWAVVEACAAAGVKLMVGCDRRFWTHNQWARQLIDEDVIGRPLMARASLHEHWRDYQGKVARTDFRLRADVAGGAALPDTGAHAVDLLTWLVGSPVRRAVGIATRLATPESFSACDDATMILLEHESGALGTVSCNRFSPIVSQATEVYGTAGTIYTATDAVNPFQTVPMAVYSDRDYTVESLPAVLRDYRWPQDFWAEDALAPHVPKRWVPIVPPREPTNYAAMIAHFVACIRDDREPLVSGEDGARAVEVMCAVHESMRTGAWVDLPLDHEVVPPGYQPLPPVDRTREAAGPW